MPRASDQRKARCETRNPCGERGMLEERAIMKKHIGFTQLD